MEIAALVLGIISFLLSFIPGCGLILGSIPALIGFILAIVSIVKKKPKKGMAIAGLILSILAVIIMIGMLFLGLGTYIFNTASSEINSSKDLFSELNKEVKKNTKYKVGETYKDDEISIKFVSVNQDFKDYNSYATVEEGYKIVKAEFEFENLSTVSKYVSAYKFECYADGYDCDKFWSVSDSGFSSTLSEGKKIKGSVYFEVPKDATEINLEYTINSYKNEIVKFVVK